MIDTTQLRARMDAALGRRDMGDALEDIMEALNDAITELDRREWENTRLQKLADDWAHVSELRERQIEDVTVELLRLRAALPRQTG